MPGTGGKVLLCADIVHTSLTRACTDHVTNMADDDKVARLRASFNRFDKDGSGFIDKQEMREVVKGMYDGLDVPESVIIAEADVSHIT